jgi:hypothetical protein
MNPSVSLTRFILEAVRDIACLAPVLLLIAIIAS